MNFINLKPSPELSVEPFRYKLTHQTIFKYSSIFHYLSVDKDTNTSVFSTRITAYISQFKKN